jgi:hypothetical protein
MRYTSLLACAAGVFDGRLAPGVRLPRLSHVDQVS